MSENKNQLLQLFSKTEAAKQLHIGKEKLNQLIEEGEIGIINLRGQFKVPFIELLRFIEKNTVYVNKEGRLSIHNEKEDDHGLSEEFDSIKLFEKINMGE